MTINQKPSNKSTPLPKGISQVEADFGKKLRDDIRRAIRLNVELMADEMTPGAAIRVVLAALCANVCRLEEEIGLDPDYFGSMRAAAVNRRKTET